MPSPKRPNRNGRGSLYLCSPGCFVSLIAIMCLTKIDRVVTSVGGKLVSTERVNVFQALDPSIIKSINVHEGDEVEAGQVLATLDPTFAAADVKQLKQQVAGLRAQIARDEAQLNNHPFVLPPKRPIPTSSNPQPCKGNFIISKSRNIRRNSQASMRKSARRRRPFRNIKRMRPDIKQREQIAKQIEDMRTTLAEHGTGSQLNLLTSQDSAHRYAAHAGLRPQQPDRGATYVSVANGRPRRVYPAVVRPTEPGSCHSAQQSRYRPSVAWKKRCGITIWCA